MKSKFLFALMLGALFALGACNNEKDEPSGEEGKQGENFVGGHEYVDLGLPSGTLWATCNVGASSPEKPGSYFAWGETSQKNFYGWNNLAYCISYDDNTGQGSFSKYNDTDGLSELQASDDAATFAWGSSWRTPTGNQYRELVNECSWVWAKQNEVNGLLATGPNGKTIFFPAAGFFYEGYVDGMGEFGDYWSCSTFQDTNANSFAFGFEDELDFGVGADARMDGLSVRAVVVR
ncbi:MAG: hypothetical protein J6Z12_01145 [Paludibacteraceae bacterium]|nr:hypothetical protein [Paludibacteraceae bacterium]